MNEIDFEKAFTQKLDDFCRFCLDNNVDYLFFSLMDKQATCLVNLSSDDEKYSFKVTGYEH